MTSIKKIALIGGTGMTGVCSLDYAISSGLKVRALLRPTSELPSQYEGKIEVVRGDVLDEAAVKNTIRGTDGVVFVLGTRDDVSATTLLSSGLKVVLAAMREVGVKPISVCLTSFLFLPPDQIPFVFRVVTEDHQRMLDTLLRSDVDWVAIFPPHIADEPPSDFKIDVFRLPGRAVVSKRDLGKFLVTSISDPKNYRKLYGISSADPN